MSLDRMILIVLLILLVVLVFHPRMAWPPL